jgi:hypothetical protein
MASNPNLLEVLKHLDQTIRENLNQLAAALIEFKRSDVSSPLLYHVVDFGVILVADILAAMFVLVTFESWRERDRMNVEKAQRILEIIGPACESLISSIPSCLPGMKSAPNGAHYLSWRMDPDLHSERFHHDLNAGSIYWEYPDSQMTLDALSDLQKKYNQTAPTMSGIALPAVEAVLASALSLNKIRKAEVEPILARAHFGQLAPLLQVGHFEPQTLACFSSNLTSDSGAYAEFLECG